MYVLLCYFLTAGVEYWVESDFEIDEDIEGAHVPPPDLPDIPESQEMAEINMITRWIITLLSIFQTWFFLTNHAVNWLLKFLCVLLQFLGRYSTTVAQLASHLPQSVYKCNMTLKDIFKLNTFERRVVCVKCNSLYTFMSSTAWVSNNCDAVHLQALQECL